MTQARNLDLAVSSTWVCLLNLNLGRKNLRSATAKKGFNQQDQEASSFSRGLMDAVLTTSTANMSRCLQQGKVHVREGEDLSYL